MPIQNIQVCLWYYANYLPILNSLWQWQIETLHAQDEAKNYLKNIYETKDSTDSSDIDLIFF